MPNSDQRELFARITEADQETAEQQITKEQRIIDYDVHEYPVEVIVLKYITGINDDTNEIFVPSYQRKFVWDTKQQSKFIESLMLGLPIPYIFTADEEGRMEVVDGSQRIRTLEAFLSNKLRLEGLKTLDKLNDFTYEDLPLARQRKLRKRTIRIIELTDKATWEVRKEMFERINTTPVKLSDMEIRKGIFEGAFQDFVKECSENVKFIMLCPISDTRADREERPEMVLRFFAYSEKYKSFVHVVRDFLDEYMKEKQEGFNAEVANKLREDFEDMLDFVWKYFPYGFKKSYNARTTPRVRFEAISVGVHLALEIKPDLIPKDVTAWLESDEFKEHTRSDAANNRNKVLARFEYVRDKLLEA